MTWYRQQTSTKLEKAYGHPCYDESHTDGVRASEIGHVATASRSIHEETTNIHMIMMKTKSGSLLHPRRHNEFRLAASFRPYHPYRGQRPGQPREIDAVEHQASFQRYDDGNWGIPRRGGGARVRHIFVMENVSSFGLKPPFVCPSSATGLRSRITAAKIEHIHMLHSGFVSSQSGYNTQSLHLASLMES
jgi:hypothetical protein